VYRDSGLSGFPQHYLGVDDLPSIVSYPITSLMFLGIYISYSRIGYCLVVYTVPCLGGHLCSGTQCGDSTDPSEAFPVMYGSGRT
jgi:hypothetical protein